MDRLSSLGAVDLLFNQIGKRISRDARKLKKHFSIRMQNFDKNVGKGRHSETLIEFHFLLVRTHRELGPYCASAHKAVVPTKYILYPIQCLINLNL